MSSEMTTPVFLVVMRCLDCEKITKIDSAWLLKKDADERLEHIDKSQAKDLDYKELGEVMDLIVV